MTEPSEGMRVPASERPHCLNCGSSHNTVWAEARDVEYCTSSSAFRYLCCNDCEVLFIDPLPENLSEIYPANYYSYSESGQSFSTQVKAMLERRMFRKLLRRIPGESLSALDVGGGSGWMLNVIRAADRRVNKTTVVDIQEGAAERARADGHEFYLARIEEFQAGTKFDLILLLNLIEHVDAPGAVLRKIAALLSPAGLALIKTPNYQSLDARIFRHRNWGGYHCPRHWVLYNRASFERAATQASLEVVSANYTQGAPFWTVSILAALASRNLVKISSSRPAYQQMLYQPLLVLSAACDFLRSPFAKTSQMFFLVKRTQENKQGSVTAFTGSRGYPLANRFRLLGPAPLLKSQERR